MTVRRLLQRNFLVIHDRHLLDGLVDPRRYRYAGPRWLLRLIWQTIPRPDLIILIDVPAEVAQSRKQEVDFAETVRQCQEYRALFATLSNGHVVDGSRELSEVVQDVNQIVLRHLKIRTSCQFEREVQP